MVMKILGMIARHVTILNILLAIAVALTGMGIVFPLTRMDYRYRLPRVAQQAALPAEDPVDNTPQPLPTDYAVIGEMSLFHPERITPMDKKAEMPKPELILYGTIIDDKQQVAFVEDKKAPITSPGRGKRQSMIKKGSVISGFAVTEIARDRIVLVRGEERMTVGLMDADKRKDKNTQSRTGSSLPAVPPSVSTASSPSAGTSPNYQQIAPPKPSQPSAAPPTPRRTTANDKTAAPPVTTPQGK
ncbi:MAG: hypothetical protein KA801_02095 [Syntrophorhabdaceae bacterium]|nr:hypothetical protein [Syntrophorhabdaceae bacterium]